MEKSNLSLLMYVYICPAQQDLEISVLFDLQFPRTVPKFTSPVTRSVECTKSILMVWVNLKSSVTTKQPVEDGQCFKRDGMAL